MQEQSANKKEPLNLKIILPLVAVILLLSAVSVWISLSKAPYSPMTTSEITESFSSYVAKIKDREHYKLFIGHKKVSLPLGPSLVEFLPGADGADLISGVGLTYEIPVYLNLGGDWIFTINENTFLAQAPLPTFGDPIFRPASLSVSFRSELSEEKKAVIRDTLKESLAAYRVEMDPISQANLELESREKAQDFLGAWLRMTFKNLPDFKYKVSFTGSKSAETPEEP